MKKSLKPVNNQQNPGLAKLPSSVRNKMGYMKKGGMVKGYKNGGAVIITLNVLTANETISCCLAATPIMCYGPHSPTHIRVRWLHNS